VDSIPNPPRDDWQSFTIKNGQSLDNVFDQAGVAADEIHAVLNAGAAAKFLNNLYPGDEIRILATPDKRLIALKYDIHHSKRLSVIRNGADKHGNAIFKARVIDRPLVIKTVQKSGVITRSLFHSAQQEGLPRLLIMDLVSIYDWDIDFTQDIKKGDSFTVLYEEHYRAGEKVADGPIIAARFVNKGKVYNAIRYTTDDGKSEYYTPEGNSLRKPFLRNPIDSAVISSKFDLRRKHPILSTIRAHKGVDYAAKTGTPIKATADGQIIYLNKKNGYGNTVIIQHSGNRSTLYAHMQKFAPKIRTGLKVRQGQIIGYVGKTGWATGPHLHYEFRIDGEHVDPLEQKHSFATIPASHRDDFMSRTEMLLSRLDATDHESSNTVLADNRASGTTSEKYNL
jgi:murein DD-endopeptidase MepM/ murein hydrolase activator NlpD